MILAGRYSGSAVAIRRAPGRPLPLSARAGERVSSNRAALSGTKLESVCVTSDDGARGCCGSLQAMAVVAGGAVGRRVVGPAVGTLPVELSTAGRAHPLCAGLGDAPAFHLCAEAVLPSCAVC